MRRPLASLADATGTALLHAALDPPERALVAWVGVRPQLDLRPDGAGSDGLRLLPLIACNLPLSELPEADRQLLRARYDGTTAANEARLALAARWLALLQLGGVSASVLKGLALAVRDYGDLGVRPMGDIDLLVPRDQAPRALDLLEGAGWRNGSGSSRDVLWRLRHGSDLVRPDQPGLGAIDLHWGLSDLLVGFEPRLEPITVGAHEATTLDRTDTLVHVCLHGLWAGSEARTRWVADAVTVLRAAEAIDCDRVEAVAERHEVGALLGAALAYLVAEHDVPLLGDLPARLSAQPVGVRRRLRQRALTAPPDRAAAVEGLAHLRAYWAYTRWGWTDRRALRDGPLFLAILWGVGTPRRLPAAAAAGLRRRLTRAGTPGSTASRRH